MTLIKWLGIVLGSLLLLLVLLLFLLDWNVVRDYAARQVSQMTGRSLAIAGDLHIEWSLEPRIRAEQIRFANASWSQEAHMLELAALEIRLDLLALFTGRLVIPELRLTRPRVVLEISAAGRPNWVFGADPVTEDEAAAPEERLELPTIKHLRIEEGRVVYRDLSSATEMTATITTVRDRGGHDTLNLQGKGTVGGKPLHFQAQSGSALELRQHDEPYPVAIQVKAPSTTVKIEGAIEQPLQLNGLDLAIEAQGEGVGALPPHQVQAQLSRLDNQWRLKKLQASLGQSYLTGQATLDIIDGRPMLQASLASQTLHAAQLQAALSTNAALDAHSREAETPLDTQLLRAFDANVSWQIQSLVLQAGTLNEIAVEATLQSGQLRIAPLRLAIGDGVMRAQTTLDASSGPIQGELKMEFEQAGVDRMLTLLGMGIGKAGALDGRLNLALASTDAPATPLTPSSLLRRLHVESSELRYRDPTAEADIEVAIRPEHTNGKSVIKITGQGRYRGEKIDIHAEADSLSRLVPDPESNYTVSADVALQGAQIQLHANLDDPSLATQVDIQGEDLTTLKPLLGAWLPPLSDYQLKGTFRRASDAWNVEQMTVLSDGVDLQMQAELAPGATDQPWRGAVRSRIKRLDLGKVLQPFVETNHPFGVLSGDLNLVATGVDHTQAAPDIAMPFLGRLAIKKSRLAYRDQARHIDVEASIEMTNLDNQSQAVRIDAQGTYQQEPFTLRFQGDPLLNLRDTDKPYALDASITVAQTEAHAKGRVFNPLTLPRVDMHLTMAGPNPKRLSPLLGLPLPPLPPYKLRGQLVNQEQMWTLSNFTGQVGDSELSGDMRIKLGGERPFAQAELDSRRLDFDDLAPLIGKAPEAEGGETASAEQKREQVEEDASPTVLPKKPINFDNLRRLDAAIKLRSQHIKTVLPLDNLTTEITIEAGRLTLKPLDFGVASGKVRSRIELDTRTQPPKANIDVEIRHVSLKDIVAHFDIADESAGIIGGQAKMWLQGDSVADMLASADGGLLLLMTGGHFDDLLVELAGLDFGETLAALFGDQEEKFAINCAFADIHAKQGVAQLKTFVVDTDDTLFLGDGAIDFTQEGMDLIIDPKPKDLSLFSARAPLHIQGTFAEPRIRPGASALIRGAASLAMLPVAPLAALIPLLDPEESDTSKDQSKNRYCSDFMAAINKGR